MRRALRAAFASLLTLGAAVASAQTIYRCGQTYTATPCPNAKQIAVDGSSPTAANRAEARRVAARERRLADDMARDRRLAEAAQRPAMATSLGPIKAAEPPPAKPSAKKSTKKKRKPGWTAEGDEGRDFVAAVPKVRKAPPN